MLGQPIPNADAACCQRCGAPIIGRGPTARYCGVACAKTAKLAYLRAYMKAWRKRPGAREYHRDWMERKREQLDYKERERAQQREYRLRQVASRAA